MIDEHESVIIIGLKVKHFFCDVEKVRIGHSDAQLNTSTVSALTVIMFLHRVRREAEKPSEFFNQGRT